jgi:hypothetical protein
MAGTRKTAATSKTGPKALASKIAIPSTLAVLALVVCIGLAGIVIVADDTSPRLGKSKPQGTAKALSVRGGVSNAYLRLDLSYLPVDTVGEQLSVGWLRLWISKVKRGGTFSLYPVLEPWDEETLTGMNPPLLGDALVMSRPITKADSKSYMMLDVSTIVRDWLDGVIPNHGLALVPDDGATSFAIDSKETKRAGHEPHLELMLNAGYGLQGPTGPIGPVGSQGNQGVAGPAGPQGFPGPAGPTGAMGIQGLAGLDGAAGAQGTQGTAGAVGSQGIPGSTGAQGIQGVAGSAGGAGPMGPAGAQGLAGAVGPTGPAGSLPQLHYAEDVTLSVTDLSSWQEKLKLTTNSLPAGDYWVQWYTEVHPTSSSSRAMIRVQVDDSITLTTANTSDFRDFTPSAGFAMVTLGAGVHTVDLDWRDQDGGRVAEIRNVRVSLWQLPGFGP